MQRARHSLTTLCGAVTLLLSSYVAAQAPKAAPPVHPAPAKGETRLEVIVREEMMKVAVPRPVAPARAATVEQRRKALAQQMVPRFRPLLRVEYHRLVSVCDPSPEQRRQIARAGERALRQAAEQASVSTNRVVVDPNGTRRIVGQQADPVQIIRDGLAAAVERDLPAEQADRYRHELAQQREHWRETAIGAIVSRIDEELLLTNDQRTAIAKSLRDHWNDGWAPNLATLTNLQHYFPPIPNDLIIERLDERQTKVWKASHATRQYVTFGQGGARDEGDFEDEALAEARAAEDLAKGSDEP